MFNQLRRYQSYFIAVFLLAILIFFGFGLFQEYQKNQEISQLAENLKLKAPTDKIIQYTEYDSNGQPLSNPSDNSSDNVVQYLYQTDQIVPPATHHGLKEDVSQRTSNTQIFLKSQEQISEDKIKNTYVGKFYSGIAFSNDDGRWYRVESATTTKTAFLKQINPTLLANAKKLLGQPVFAIAYNPSAGDGYVGFDSAFNWLITHNSLSGSTGDNDYLGPNIYTRVAETGNNDDYLIYRSFLPFDTSSIPTGSSIVSASLSIYVSAKTNTDNDATDYINVVNTTQVSTNSLTEEDYDQCGDVSSPGTGATSIDIGSIATSDYNAFTLNSTGLSWVKNCSVASGFTCLGLREGHDIEDSQLTFTKENSITYYSSEQTGTSQDPFLEVTYVVINPTLTLNSGSLQLNSASLKLDSN